MNPNERRALEVLLDDLRREIRLVEAQLARSRAARGVPAASVTAAPLTVGPSAPSLASAERSGSRTPSRGLVPTASPTPAKPEERFSSRAPAAETLPTVKTGYLWHLVGPNDAGALWHYFVMDQDGVRWYENKTKCVQRARPLGKIDFSLTTTNSRGSVFRKAAVCWPLILPEDYPSVANDQGKTYFAIDYYVRQRLMDSIFGGSGVDGSGLVSRKLVLATAFPSERDEWVCFLRQYIDIYLAPRAESEELQYLVASTRAPSVGTAGSNSLTPPRRPRHRSEVIDGEAPGGNYL